jgi:poly(ADP-ribose) glycohydrolase ARH3
MHAPTSAPPSLQDRFLGCLLGLAVGDAIGAPFEGLPATAIWYDFGGARKLVSSPPVELLTYTDDTQMMIAVAETLTECGRIDEETLCARFVENYDPNRGYGRGARRILETMAAGGDWRQLAQTVFPGGSLGNGAAMRVAPVGLLFHRDVDALLEQARLSALPTHSHPIGIEGAQLLALAIALVLREPRFDKSAFYEQLLAQARTYEFRHQLELAAGLSPTDSIASLGSSLEAHRSVTTAIACFTMSPDSYATTIASAIGLGDDTDTLAAMAGAIAGAHLGIDALPPHLLNRLENGTKGRDYINRLAINLHERFLDTENPQ